MAENDTGIKPRYNENLMLIQANELVRAKQDDLTILEARIIRLAIAQVLKGDKDFKTYRCNVIELSKFLQMPKSNIYREVVGIRENLLRKLITIYSSSTDEYGNKGFKSFHWVDSIEYREGSGEIILKLSDELKPYLLGLEQLFTMYGYETLLHLPTNYSIRLFELLISWQNKYYSDSVEFYSDLFELEQGEVAFTIDYLRTYFNCENKYPSTGDFVKRVIDSSVEYINKNSIMKISSRKIKNGTKIEYIVFKYLHTEIDKEWQDKMRDARLLVERLNDEYEAQLTLDGDIW